MVTYRFLHGYDALLELLLGNFIYLFFSVSH
jgi:hypothetical protein